MVVCGYIGQSGFGDLKSLEPEELMALWKTAGADKAPRIYQELLKCEKVMTFKLLGVDPARVLSKVERSRTLNVQELLLSWCLGTNQREKKLPDARAARGLPWLPKMLGLNIDPCTKRPSQDALAQKFGPTDGGYLYLRSQECRLCSTSPAPQLRTHPTMLSSSDSLPRLTLRMRGQVKRRTPNSRSS